uniref:phytanoyl-CoA dioxygenase n=1 Tax=Timema shepardi TaxID=629360 RepID=A0A7R9FYX3_TIMSH|nr:unnamed protein product [Timema shepardi]
MSERNMRFLSKEQVEFYKENGFVKFGDVFTNEEFDRFDKEYTYLFENKLNTFGNGLESKWLGKEMDKLANNKPTTVKSIHNLQFHSGVFNDVVNNKNLLDALEDVMDTPNILLHHTKAHLKPPEKGAPYLMHQGVAVGILADLASLGDICWHTGWGSSVNNCWNTESLGVSKGSLLEYWLTQGLQDITFGLPTNWLTGGLTIRILMGWRLQVKFYQDYHYFPFKKHSMVAVFIHMDDTTPENGGLAVYPGSHKLGPLEEKKYIDKGEAFHWIDNEKFPLSKATPISAKRGEVVIFSYLLIHGSYANSSTDRVRRMFLIQLMSADDEPIEDTHRSPGQGTVLRGRNKNRPATMDTRFVH